MLLRLALIFFQDQKYTILCPSGQKNFCWEIWAYLYKWLGIFPLLPQHNLSKDTGMGWKYDSVAKSACHTTMRTWVAIFLPVSGAPVFWGGARRFFVGPFWLPAKKRNMVSRFLERTCLKGIQKRVIENIWTPLLTSTHVCIHRITL